MAEINLFQEKYRVVSVRLPGYDYGQSGAYFVTICTGSRVPYFGAIEVPGGDWSAAFLQPTELGQRVLAGWSDIPKFAPFVTLDAFVLMPDHLHGLLLFDKNEPAAPPVPYENRFGPQQNNLAAVLRGFKAGISSFAKVQGLEFSWQPGFYDRIVRSGDELIRIQQYILSNPSRWRGEWDNGEGICR